MINQFLYNGNKLPALPDWDKEAYPFALMFFRSQSWWLQLFKIRPYMSPESDYTLYFRIPKDTYSIVYWAKNGEWVLNDGNHFTHGGESDHMMLKDSTQTGATERFWANFDMYNEDGTLYLAASDPIPITAPEPLDPVSMMMGWHVGRRIAAQRKRV